MDDMIAKPTEGWLRIVNMLNKLWAAWRQRYAPLRLAAVITALLVVLSLLLGGWQRGAALDRIIHDARIRYATATEEERRIIIIDIDEASLQKIGPWPWPRKTTAHLIQRLFDHYGVALVSLDIVFPDARPDDGLLRDVFARYPVVAAETFDETPNSPNRLGVLGPGIKLVGAQGPLANYLASGFIANAASLYVADQAVGHITPSFDPDGVVRRVKPLLCLDNDCAPSLALRIFMTLLQSSALRLEKNYWLGSSWRLEPEAGVSIPLDRDGQVLIPWRINSHHLRAISAQDIISGHSEADSLENSIAIIGSTAFGLGDRVPAPNRALAPGLEVHVQLLSALLDNRLPRTLSLPAQVLILCFAALILPAFTGRKAGVSRLLAMSVVMGTAVVVLDGLIWHFGLLVLPTGSLLILIGGSFLLLAPLEARQLHKTFQQFRHKISMFIPEAVTARLADPDAGGDPGLQACEISVLFADVRGFTAAIEKLSPDKAALLANRLLTDMSVVVAGYGGTIEKFTGDGLMAIWETPGSLHAQSAISCGIALRAAISHGLRDWLVANDFSPLDLVIGVNTGIAAVGVYGGELKKAYSAHGDVVNVAQRLEILTREVEEPLLMGESTAIAIGIEHTRLVGEFSVKGRQGKVHAYAPLD